MSHEVTVTMRLNSSQSCSRIEKLLESLFEFGTIKESIADGLHLLEDPHLLQIDVAPSPPHS